MAEKDNKQPENEFVRVYSTPKLGEVALIKSLLDGQNMPYYVKGENFGTFYGPADGLSTMDIMVRKDCAQDAEELLKDFINPAKINRE